MKQKSEPIPSKTCSQDAFCAGSCGSPGLCPGIALFLAYAVGGGIGMMTGLSWLGWSVGIPLALFLLTGAWRWLPVRRTAPVKFDAEQETPIHPE